MTVDVSHQLGDVEVIQVWATNPAHAQEKAVRAVAARRQGTISVSGVRPAATRSLVAPGSRIAAYRVVLAVSPLPPYDVHEVAPEVA